MFELTASGNGGCGTLWERSRELELIRMLMAELSAGRPGVLLVEGMAGIGKTALLQAACRRGGGGGVGVGRPRGGGGGGPPPVRAAGPVVCAARRNPTPPRHAGRR